MDDVSQKRQGLLDPGHSVRVRLFPLVTLFIIAATAMPLEFREPSWHYVSWHVHPQDAVHNVLLFLPLGIALSRWEWYRIILVAGFLSVLAESSQLISISRYGGVIDTLFNVLGAVLGSFAPRIETSCLRLGHGILEMSSKLLVAISLICGAIIMVAFLTPSRGTSDFSNWDPRYQLAVVDELTRDRPWSGRLLAWAIFDRELDSGFIRKFKQQPLTSDPDLTIGSIPLKPVLYVKTNSSPPAISTFATLSPDQSRKVYEALSSKNTMSLAALIWIDNVKQGGPARIVTQSAGPFHRNFTLGQEGKRIVFRLRTPMTGLNGLEPEVQSEEILQARQLYFLVATYDSFLSRLFVNGRLTGTANLQSLATWFPDLYDTLLSPAITTCGFALVVVSFALGRWPGSTARWILGIFGGLVSAVAVWELGDIAVRWTPLTRLFVPGIVGGLAAAMSIVGRPTLKELGSGASIE